MSEPELKPCPFCGGEAVDATYWIAHPVEYFGRYDCADCEIEGPLSEWKHDDKSDAQIDGAKAWNARPTPKVKPLAWEQSTPKKHEGCVEYAETQIGTYFIVYDNDDFTGYYCDFVYLGNCTWFGAGGANSRVILDAIHDDDLTEIKAAAQADYERRILEALE